MQKNLCFKNLNFSTIFFLNPSKSNFFMPVSHFLSYQHIFMQTLRKASHQSLTWKFFISFFLPLHQPPSLIMSRGVGSKRSFCDVAFIKFNFAFYHLISFIMRCKISTLDIIKILRSCNSLYGQTFSVISVAKTQRCF
jgi:hypothetical protein